MALFHCIALPQLRYSGLKEIEFISPKTSLARIIVSCQTCEIKVFKICIIHFLPLYLFFLLPLYVHQILHQTWRSKLLYNRVNNQLQSSSPVVSQYLHRIRSITLHNYTKPPNRNYKYHKCLFKASRNILLQLQKWLLQCQKYSATADAYMAAYMPKSTSIYILCFHRLAEIQQGR